MRHLTAVIFLLFRLISPGALQAMDQETESTPAMPRIEFDGTSHDFGNQTAGSILKHSFRFVNKGNAPLFIESVKAG